ncbi:non-canonical purine NTP pyrophosphatase [Clostridia bacterium]|nr:non-canonical purine NTP pyrophosphatase [Clostridia bacterium]
MKFVLATNNRKKLLEMREILSGSGIELVTLAELGAEVNPEETGDTFEENAEIKARAAMEATGLPSMADDSGLCVDALDGAPGVRSARYGGFEGKPDAERNKFLLEQMEKHEVRTARFVCAVVGVFPDGKIISARGEIAGEIQRECEGEGGFGYDPLFYVPEYNTTMAGIPAETKNRISHRARALAEFRASLKKYLEADI